MCIRDSSRIKRVVSRRLLNISKSSGREHDCLVALRQLVKLRKINQQVIRGAAFPPARIIIVLSHFIKAELLVIVGAYPFGGVDGALLQSWINVASSELLWNKAKLGKCFTGPATDAHLQASKVCWLLDLFVKPAAHLSAGITHQNAFRIEFRAEVVDQLLAVTCVKPSVLLAGVESERCGTEKRPGRILAEKII